MKVVSRISSVDIAFFSICLMLIIITSVIVNKYDISDFSKCRSNLYDLELIKRNFEAEMFLGADAFPQNRSKTKNQMRIVILLVANETSLYRRAMSTLECYSKIHGYDFRVESDEDYIETCNQRDIMYRRHCMAAIILHDYDYLLFLDTDVGVVNPNRTIEEFIDDNFDITFYNRFFNHEIAAGSYLVKNTNYAKKFLNAFANFDKRQNLNQFQGSDNGGLQVTSFEDSMLLQALIAEYILGEDSPEFRICMDAYGRAQKIFHLFEFEACIQSALGSQPKTGRIRIMPKGKGWVRDGWLTNGMWNPSSDFMIHGWKEENIWGYNLCDLPIDITLKRTWLSIYPILGEIDLQKCDPGHQAYDYIRIFRNTSWSYDINLIVGNDEIQAEYSRMKFTIDQEAYTLLGSMSKSLGFYDRLP